MRGSRPSSSAPQALSVPSQRVGGSAVKATLAACQDQDLVALAQQGERAALEELLRRHSAAIYRVLLRTLGSSSEADDALQDTFIVVARNLRKFRGDSRISTWMIGISLRVARRQRHKALRRQPAQDPESMPRLAAADATANPERLSGARDTLSRIESCLQRIGHKHREAYVLRVVEGTSVKEIAETLGASENTVKSRIAAARRKLASELRKDPGLRGLLRERGEGEAHEL